jgi:ubiquinone/menaquinone biosynthesis C-methylase UbiE
MGTNEIRDVVKERYGQAARNVGKGGGCCGTDDSMPLGGCEDPITAGLYSDGEAAMVPATALSASLGCGNPTALAELRPGEVVLDLGSGGGIDVLLSARRVGPTGKAYGLDMTPEMLALARENQRKAGVTNVEFLEGHIEAIPLPNDSVDVIISNCVINLSGDKDAVLREAFRVLKPGGRFAVSDVVLRKPLPTAIQGLVAAWTGCVAGALLEGEYREKLDRAGFADIRIEPTRVYEREDVAAMAENIGAKDLLDGPLAGIVDEVAGQVMSAFVRARKPASA